MQKSIAVVEQEDFYFQGECLEKKNSNKRYKQRNNLKKNPGPK